MNAILLDANFLVAWLDPKDALHDRASEIDIGLGARLERLLVDVAVTEALGVIARRCEEQKRSKEFVELLDFFRAYAPANRVIWVYPLLRELYGDCLDVLERSAGRLNFIDALMALYMQRSKIRYLASFDTDFDELPAIQRISTAQQATSLSSLSSQT